MTAHVPAELLERFSKRDSVELRRTPDQRDLRLRRLFRLQWCGFVLLLAGSVAVLVILVPDFLDAHPVAFSVVVAVAVVKHVLELFGLLGGEAFRYRDAPEDLSGVLEPEELDSLTARVSERLGKSEKPNFYIAIDKEANAFSTNSMLFNSIPRYNAIFLNSYLFHAFSRDELRAVVVHELAHFYRYIGPLGRNAWLGVVGSIAACVTLFSWVPELTEPWTAIFVIWWAPLPFLWIFNLVASSGQRDLEYACDAIAAEIVGAESMANALLKMGDRAEIYELVEHEMGRHLDENPKAKIPEISQALLDRIPDVPVDHDEARRALRSEPMPEDDGGDKKESRKLVALIRRNHKLRKALDVMRWSRFDTIRRDGWLDREELHRYVMSLSRGEFAATHEVAVDHPDNEPDQTHPSTRKRIICLYLHFLT